MLLQHTSEGRNSFQPQKPLFQPGGYMPPDINHTIQENFTLPYIPPGWPITSRAFFVEFRRCLKIFKNIFQKRPI